MGVLGAERDGSSLPHAHLLRQAGGTLGAANQVYNFALLLLVFQCSRR